jgi:hypothetical protein
MKPRAVGSILRAGPLHQKTWSFQAGNYVAAVRRRIRELADKRNIIGRGYGPHRCAQCWGMYRKESDDHQDEAAELSEKWNRVTDKERESMASRCLRELRTDALPSYDVQRVATVRPLSRIAGARSLGSVFADIAHRKIRAIRMMEDQRTHARFRIHHEAFRKLNTDLFRLQ